MPASARRAGCLSFCLFFRASAEALPPILVTAPREDDYRAAMSPAPAVKTTVTRGLLDDLGARGVRDLIGADASVGENYAPVGYYEALSIRGFTLDQASGYKRNGLTIVSEASIPLENKERVEVLKGIGGFESGLAAPGGVIDYVTKRPGDSPTRRLSAEFRERGTRYAHGDWGGRLRAFGWRLNGAYESFHPYVKEAVGQRSFYSAALDWRLSERAVVTVDADWQKRSQLSVPGTQPLGGRALPSDVAPERMLNNQAWSRPVAIESSNLGGSFLYQGETWRLDLAGNRSLARAEDKAAFPYGCSSGPASLSTFCGNGDYDLYDYRSSGEVRAAAHAQAVLSAKGLELGVSRLRRTVDLGTEVYASVGTDNLYNPAPRAFAPSALGTGKVHRVQDYVEQAVFLRDAATWGGWTLRTGLRVSRVEDDRFSKANGAEVASFARTYASPQAALSFAPEPDRMGYLAYSQGLELGGTAGVTTANAGMVLDPKVTRQVEAGLKRDVGERLLLGAATFHIWKPYEFVDPGNVFRRRGTVRHSGLELSAFGRLVEGLRLAAGATLLRARQSGTGVAAFEGRSPLNVPWLRSQLLLDWAPARLGGVALQAVYARVETKYALRDNSLAVPGYNRVDLGARWTAWAGRTRVVWRARVENAFDALYWRDVGEYFGDGYLHLGAPRTFKLSAQIDF